MRDGCRRRRSATVASRSRLLDAVGRCGSLPRRSGRSPLAYFYLPSRPSRTTRNLTVPTAPGRCYDPSRKRSGAGCLPRSSKPLSRSGALGEVGSIPMRFRHARPQAARSEPHGLGCASRPFGRNVTAIPLVSLVWGVGVERSEPHGARLCVAPIRAQRHGDSPGLARAGSWG